MIWVIRMHLDLADVVCTAIAMQAQRRFRERQKTLIGDLRENVRALQTDVEAQAKQIFVLQVSTEMRNAPLLITCQHAVARRRCLSDGGGIR